MSKIMLIAVILIPVLTGVLVPVIPFRKRRHMEVFLEAGVVFNTLLVWSLLGHRPTDSFILAKFTGDLAIAFRVDGMGMFFAGLVSFLWPLATLFSFEYMTKEKHEKVFFMFYTITYGVTLGIALADNILTMYFFYELLTLVTVPLVMHTLTREDDGICPWRRIGRREDRGQDKCSFADLRNCFYGVRSQGGSLSV